MHMGKLTRLGSNVAASWCASPMHMKMGLARASNIQAHMLDTHIAGLASPDRPKSFMLDLVDICNAFLPGGIAGLIPGLKAHSDEICM